MLGIEAEVGSLIKVLKIDGKDEIILIKLNIYYQQQSIIIKYITLYLYIKNSLAKRGWKTLITVKDSLLINSGLFNNFWVKTIETANYLHNQLSTKTESHRKFMREKK